MAASKGHLRIIQSILSSASAQPSFRRRNGASGSFVWRPCKRSQTASQISAREPDSEQMRVSNWGLFNNVVTSVIFNGVLDIGQCYETSENKDSNRILSNE
jgi:hypothetical protein